MSKKNKNIVIVILTIIILCLAGLITFILIKPDNEEVKENNIKNQQETKKYKNYTSAEFTGVDSSTDDMDEHIFKLEVKDGTLIATEDSDKIKVNGITGKVKSFTYVANQHARILVITEDNNVYEYDYDLLIGKGQQSLDFEKIETNEDIVNITSIDNYVIDVSFPDYLADNLAVVLSNGEIRAIENDYDKGYVIGKEDYSK